MLKWIIGIVVSLVVVAGGGAVVVVKTGAIDKLKEKLNPKAEASVVQVEEVSRGDLVRTVNAPGEIEPFTKVEISAQVVARILALPFREGEDVRAGDVIIRLDGEDLSARLESTQAGLKGEEARLLGAQAALKQAKANLGRDQSLYDTNDLSLAQLDASEAASLRAESNLMALEQQIEIARANIRRAQKDLENTVITSPIDGTITKLNAEVGELVMVGTLNNPGSVILEIADLSTMVMRARVDETNIEPVKAGQDTTVYLNAYPDREFAGRVNRVRLVRELWRDGTGYVEAEVLLTLKEGQRVYTGLTSNVDIEVDTIRDAIKISSQAIQERRIDELPKKIMEDSPHIDKDKTFANVVYRMVEGKGVVTPVVTGPSDLSDTVILAGLEQGDVIIVGPYKVLLTLKHEQDVKEEGADEEEDAEKSAEDAEAGDED